MNFSDAIEAVQKIYVPGVVKFYAGQNPDPWQAAHDEVEAFVHSPWSVKEAACSRFVDRCTELVARFKREGTAKKTSAAEIGFYSGTNEKADRWTSVTQKRCAECMGREGLRLVSDPSDGLAVKIMCAGCAGKRTA